jgi:hypothetical protein
MDRIYETQEQQEAADEYAWMQSDESAEWELRYAEEKEQDKLALQAAAEVAS